MKEYILKNKIKLIYKESTSKLTSISIGLDAGAAVDNILGIAHATEHMVYKGTINRSESQINKDLSNIFGFHNAMTNYPYVIYYGTLLVEDFEEGVEVLSDIILNPIFHKDGFEEEMKVIKEELKEWDEELDQHCEDKLFFNCFKNRRIKYPIIGTEDELEKITLDNIKDFYEKFYIPSNTSIAIVSSLKFEQVKAVIEKYFEVWDKEIEKQYFKSWDKEIEKRYVESLHKEIVEEYVELSGKEIEGKSIELHEKLGQSMYKDSRDGVNTNRVQLIFDISDLNSNEMRALRVFDEYFGVGVNSILFDTLRTKNGLVYDVLTTISFEKHIKLYKIAFNTSKDNVEKSLNLINRCIDNLIGVILTQEEILLLSKGLRIKKLFKEEKSIQVAKELSTYSVMFGDYNEYEKATTDLELLDGEFIISIGKRVLKNGATQIITD